MLQRGNAYRVALAAIISVKFIQLPERIVGYNSVFVLSLRVSYLVFSSVYKVAARATG